MSDAKDAQIEDRRAEPALPDEELDRLRRERFRERVGRVLAVMRQERIDWRGRPYLTSDGRIGVRVEPVEMGEP